MGRPPRSLRPESADEQDESHNDGGYSVHLNVTDEDIEHQENANPVITLRMPCDAWKVEGGGG